MEWASALVSALGEHEAPCNDEPTPYYQGTPSTRERHSRLMAQTSCPSQKPGAFAPELERQSLRYTRPTRFRQRSQMRPSTGTPSPESLRRGAPVWRPSRGDRDAG